MKLRVAGEKLTGRAIDLSSHSVTPDAVLRAIAGDAGMVSIECAQPSAVHDHVGYIHPRLSLSQRSALAAAGRSNGCTAPQDAKLRTVRDEIARLDPPAVHVREARKRVAETGKACERLHESIATQRGRVQALRDLGEDATDAESALREAIAALSEQETKRIAATQSLSHAEQQARRTRDLRERRLRLEDQAANLQREARRSLAAQLASEFDEVKAQAPNEASEHVAGALAIARIATVRAPLVLTGSWFETATAAADWLGAPIIWL